MQIFFFKGNDHLLKFENWKICIRIIKHYTDIDSTINTRPHISCIQCKNWTFEDTKHVFRSGSLWELSKGLKKNYDKGPLHCASVYHSVMKLSQVRTEFHSEITELRWLELPITWTHFGSPFEFKPSKFHCNCNQCIFCDPAIF
jgi:hypothetical protein